MHAVPSVHHIVAHAAGADVAKKAAACVTGAYVADAASLGLHWVYNVKEIATAVGSDAPEFHELAAPWHAGKRPGDASMYGESLLVTLRSLRAKHGWSKPGFITEFYKAFGPGGTYVGYADHATKDTIINIMAFQKEQEAAMKAPIGFADGAVRMAVHKQLKDVVEQNAGEALAAAAAALTTTANPAATADTIEFVKGVAAKLEELSARNVGSDDNQSNALAKVPALVARYAGHRNLLHIVIEATRQTANNEEALTWVPWAARVLEAVVMGAGIKDAVTVNLVHLEQPYRAALEHAVHLAGDEEDYIEAVGRLGQACQLASVVPAAIYLALRHEGATTFTQAVRENMLAGGDSNGRAIFLGALVAAASASAAAPSGGVPEEWLARVNAGGREEVASLSADIHIPAVSDAATDHIEVHKATPRGL